MPAGQEPLVAIVLRLEREVADLRARTRNIPDRQAEARRGRNPRIARTVKGPESEYPAREDCPNTYWIVFTDSTFTAATGRQDVASTDRQDVAQPKALAHNLIHGIEAYVPEGTPIIVNHDNGKWWFVYHEATECASDGSGSGSEGSTGEVTLDVVVCDPWNRCGQYLVFPQRRLHLPAGVWWEDLPATVVPLYECQSSGDSGGSDTESDGEVDGLCVWCLEVSGDLVPAEAVGQYFPLWFKINGHCVWQKTGTDWYILRTTTPVAAWGIFLWGSSPQKYWFRAGASVLGAYTPGPNVTGAATVAVCQESSSSSSPPPEPCDVFDADTTPAAIDVALNTLTEGGCAEGCETSFGGTHRCVQVPELPCTYYHDFGVVCGVACELLVTFTAGVDIECRLNMGDDYIRWVLASQSGNGLSYADLALNFHSNTPTAPCGGSGSNCAITSVA